MRCSAALRGRRDQADAGSIAEGNRVAVETESYADVKNGRTYNNHCHFVFEVRDGKVESVKEYLDTKHTRAIFLAP